MLEPERGAGRGMSDEQPSDGDAFGAGEDLEVLPARIVLRTQDTSVLENQDHDTFAVGGLRVGPDQTMTYTFSEPGNYGGSCQLHEGGSVDIVVV